MESTWSLRRVRTLRSNKRRDQTELRRELLKDKRAESLTPRLLSNSVNKDFMPASAQDPVNPAEPTDTFWKADNFNSMLRRSNHQEKNDYLS